MTGGYSGLEIYCDTVANNKADETTTTTTTTTASPQDDNKKVTIEQTDGRTEACGEYIADNEIRKDSDFQKVNANNKTQYNFVVLGSQSNAYMYDGRQWQRMAKMSVVRDKPACSLVQHDDGSVRDYFNLSKHLYIIERHFHFQFSI